MSYIIQSKSNHLTPSLRMRGSITLVVSAVIMQPYSTSVGLIGPSLGVSTNGSQFSNKELHGHDCTGK